MTLFDASLLGEDETSPTVVTNAGGRSPFLLIGDHAGNAVPRALADLGLAASDRERHIAWDIGVRDLGTSLAAALDACFVHQHYSRLVIDCNRDPDHPDAVPALADGSVVRGNRGLSIGAHAARVTAIHRPYHDHIAHILAGRLAAGRSTVLLALHSFTPVLGKAARPWHIGVLHGGGNAQFALALLSQLGRREAILVGDNEPYRMDDTDYSVPRHAFPVLLPYAEIEIRQDLIADAAGVETWTERLRAACLAALDDGREP